MLFRSVKADDDAKLIYEDLVKNDTEEVSLPDTKENTNIYTGAIIYTDSIFF